MFFYLSKIFWTFAQPVSLIGILLFVSIAAALLNRRRLSLSASVAAFLLLALFGWTTFGALLLQPLESRFARPAEMPQAVDGIIVLGGAFEGGINPVRGLYELSEAADRMTEGAILALRYPNAKVIISGGSGTILRERAGDADTAPLLFEKLGVPRSRLILDTESRNTAENAAYTKQLGSAAPGETWLLVTSAFHMPRSMGLFRKAGFDVVPWPTDYRTAGNEGFGGCRENSLGCLRHATTAIREWLGLAAYRLTGKIDRFLPAP